jgi:hypothetical protein
MICTLRDMLCMFDPADSAALESCFASALGRMLLSVGFGLQSGDRRSRRVMYPPTMDTVNAGIMPRR